MNPYRAALYAILGANLAFRLLFVAFGPFDLVADEAYYWDWSRHLDWSYYSKGPLVAYLIALSTRLGGNTEFFVRLPSVLLSALTFLAVHRLALRFYASERIAFFSALTFACVPLFNVGATLMTIDNPVFACWTLAAFFTHRAVVGGRTRDWAFAGIAFGFGIMAKAVILFHLVALFGFLLASGERRVLLRTRGPWMSVAIGFLFFLPQIYWNSTHDWVMFRDFMKKGEVGEPFRIEWKFFPEMIGAQAGAISPPIWGACLFALWANWKRWRAARDETALFVLAWGLPILLFYTLLSFRTRINGNWPTLTYLTPTIAAAAEILRRADSPAPGERFAGLRARRFGIAALVVGGVMSAALFLSPIPYALGFSAHARIDPTKRLRGWEEWGERIGEIGRERSEGRPIFYSGRIYQIAGLLGFYVPGNPKAYCFVRDARSNQYYFINDFDAVLGMDAIYVAEKEKDVSRIDDEFDSVEFVEKYETKLGGAVVREYFVYHCRNFKGWKYRE